MRRQLGAPGFLVAGLVLLAACNPFGPTTTTGIIVPANADPLVGHVLSDGEITDQEFETVVNATVDCMRREGVDVTDVHVDDDGGYGWTFTPDPASEAIQATCRARFIAPVVEARAANR